MLKTPNAQYLKISERDYFLWKLLDGQHSLLELALAYQQTYRSFALERILGLVAKLKQNGFLDEPVISIYSQLQQQLNLTGWRRFTNFMQRSVLRLEMPITGLDKPFDKLYRFIGWVGFTVPFFWFSLLVILGGLAAFIYNTTHNHFFLIDQNIAPGLNLVWLLLGYALAIFLHELAHGLTIKHFKGEVRSGGMMIFYGMPAFYVNTSDIWMYERPKRILTSWAGPYMNFLVGGLCALVLWLNPTSNYAQVLFSLAFTCYIGAIFNLNVLLELDGYYILIDWLEIPQLRHRSLSFIRYKVWGKLWRREKFNREENIFSWFGLFTLLYTSFTIIYTYWSMQTQIARWLQESFNQVGFLNRLWFGLGALFLAFVIFFSLGPILWQIAKWASLQVWRWVLASELYLAAIWLLGLGLGWVLTLGWTGSSQNGPAFLLLLTVVLVVAGMLGRGFFSSYGPARFMLILGLILMVGGCFPQISWLATSLAGLGLLLITLRLLRYIEVSLLGRGTRQLILSLLIISAGIGWPSVAVVTYRSYPQMVWTELLTVGLTPAIALAALALSISVIQQQWSTHFRLAHLGLGLLALSLLVSTLLQAYAQVSLNSLVSGWVALGSGLLYQLAYNRASQLPERQQAQTDLSDEARLWRSALYLLEVTLDSVKTTFGVATVRHLVNLLNVSTNTNTNASAGITEWPLYLHISEDLKATRVLQTESVSSNLVQTGKLLRQLLDEFWQNLARSCGESYARLTWERGFDSLHWEERELTTDYIFNQLLASSWLIKPVSHDKGEDLKLLASLPLFSESSPEELQHLTSACFERHYKPGEIIMKQGAVGDCFYMVKSGQVSVWQRDTDGSEKQVNTHERGGYFGELALLNNAPRNATCRSDTATILLCLRKDDFDLLARRHFTLASHLQELYHHLHLLQQIPLFRETPSHLLKSIAAQLQISEVEAGQDLIRQGESGDLFYIIESGQVEVLVESAGKTQLIDHRGPGEFFGEIALLSDTPRSATVRTCCPTRLLQLRRVDFLSLITDNDSVKRDLEKVASRRAYSLAKYQREQAS
jgi:putative peptide zinc metalloprotease protein